MGFTAAWDDRKKTKPELKKIIISTRRPFIVFYKSRGHKAKRLHGLLFPNWRSREDKVKFNWVWVWVSKGPVDWIPETNGGGDWSSEDQEWKNFPVLERQPMLPPSFGSIWRTELPHLTPQPTSSWPLSEAHLQAQAEIMVYQLSGCLWVQSNWQMK